MVGYVRIILKALESHSIWHSASAEILFKSLSLWPWVFKDYSVSSSCAGLCCGNDIAVMYYSYRRIGQGRGSANQTDDQQAVHRSDFRGSDSAVTFDLPNRKH